MKILFVCHRFPYPPKRGGKIRPFNIIRHLSEQGHDVTVASLTRSQEEAEEGQGLADYCANIISARVGSAAAMARMIVRLPTFIPSSMGYFYSPELALKIRASVRDSSFEFAMVHCSSVAPYVADLTGIPKIFDIGDVDSRKWLIYSRHRPLPMAAGYWFEGVKLTRAEKYLARQFTLCTCTTRAELETMQDFDTGTPCRWFPNGVDGEFFHPSDKDYDTNTICFVGRMDYFPNQQAVRFFCTDVLPVIQTRRPDTRFVIVGASPPRSIRRLAELPGVKVTGSVDDVRPHVQRAALSVAPLAIARGTQNKILESMAMGVPVIASREAVGGVDGIPGEHLLAADGIDDYVREITGLLESRQERQRFADAGRRRVLERHSWASSMARFDDILGETLELAGARNAGRRVA